MKILLFLCLLFPFSLFSKDSVFYSKQDSMKDIVDRIFQSDSINIQVETQGCFHYRKTTYTIIKKLDDYTLNSITDIGEKKQYANLDKKKYSDLRELCIYGFSIEDGGGCTTSVTFVISDKNTTIGFIDYRCSQDDSIIRKIENIFN